MSEKKLPEHIAIIMDGNGRYAKAKGISRLKGHNAGMLAMKEIVEKCSTIGIKYLTVYAFSTENWKRTAEEINGIFDLLVYYVDRELAKLNKNNVKVSLLGEPDRLPERANKKIMHAVSSTENNTGLHFNLAINYGGRAEIARATKSIAQDVKDGRISIDEIDEDSVAEKLYTAGMPDPDLVIRTSGEYRLSNFLLWQIAYSEFIFTDVLWPDFTPEHLMEAIEVFQGRKRNYGGR